MKFNGFVLCVEIIMAEQTPKERLLFAALDLFSYKGYNAASVDEIAESIGIKGPNIYKYFKGKEGILDELTAMLEDAYLEGMGFRDEIINSINTPQDLHDYALKQIRFTVENDTVRKLRKMVTIEQYRDPRLCKQATLHLFTNIRDLFTNVFEHLIEKGVIVDEDPQLLAMQFASPTSLMIQMCDRDYDNRDEYIDFAMKNIDFFISKYSV